MTKKGIKQRINKLKKEINYHRYLYHVLDTREISDAVLDSLKHELYRLEQQNPEFITEDSPTQRVGGEALDKFKKVYHKVKMLSLEDVFSTGEFEDWEKRIKKVSPSGKYEYFGELKIDGFAISLNYENGLLKFASTRGDGEIGEDVTKNIKTIESIPLALNIHEDENVINDDMNIYIKSIKKLLERGNLEIRGEVYMSRKVFLEINKERKKKGEPLYANPRNTAAGSIRQLDPKIAASRKLEFLPYAIITDFGQDGHKDEHNILKILGFKRDKYAGIFSNISEVESFWKDILKRREKLAYQIDGLVISVNDNATFKKLGVVGKAPRGAVAFKFPAEESTTKVEDISVQIGRTGALTPVAHFLPVLIGGTIVTRASLHNEDEIRRLDLKIGDTVIIKRSGDVIPKVVSVLKNLRVGKEMDFKMPKNCPFCGGKIERKEGEVILKCVNKKCSAKHREALRHFTSKKAFDIVGLGPQILNKLADEGLISDFADIFSLREGDLLPIERFAERSASKLIEAIQQKKEITLAKFIYSLGIQHVGEETALTLAGSTSAEIKSQKSKVTVDEVSSILKSFSLEDLEKIQDIGPKVAESIHIYFNDINNKVLLEKLNNLNIIINIPKVNLKKYIFSAKVFVLTGELEGFTRDKAKEVIRSFGGEISSSVSKKTDYLLAGENHGSKYDKAKELEVKIINEKDFLKMINS
ncbi:MAG: NAD-dependent DNA ligase LigA [Patescibacteria group bacterium]